MQRSGPPSPHDHAGGEDRLPPTAAVLPPSPRGGHDASTVLGRVGAELAALHMMVLDLQDDLGPALAAAASDGRVLRAGQRLDLVAQTLDGLSVFLGAADLRDARSGRFDPAAAAAQVRLDGLSSRLAGRTPPMPPATACGDVELF